MDPHYLELNDLNDPCNLCDAIEQTHKDDNYTYNLQQLSLHFDHQPLNCREIIWRVPNEDHAFPNEFKFCTVSNPTKIRLTLPDIPYIQHCCSSDTLKILLRDNRNKLTENGKDSIVLKGNTGKDWWNQGEYKSFEKNYCPQGLVYCGIGLSSERLRGAGAMAQISAMVNRYGAVTIKISPSLVLKLINDGAKLYKIGTKWYVKEYSQMILVDAHPHLQCGNQRNWKVLHLNGNKFGSHTDLDEIDSLNWELNYCPDHCKREGGGGGCWTHPELVFNKELKIPLTLVTLGFDNSHKCGWVEEDKHCSDCKLFHHIDQLKVIKKYFGTAMETEELAYSDLCDLLYYDDDIINTADAHGIGDFSLIKFALSLDENDRGLIGRMVGKYPILFQEEDWDKIKGIWKICKNFSVEYSRV